MPAIRRTKKPAKANPFLPAPVETTTPSDEVEVVDESDVLVQRGPLVPGGGREVPQELRVFTPPTVWPPQHTIAETVRVQVLGLHGGAGTSTVASLLGEAGFDAGCTLEGLRSADVPVVLVARTHALGAHLVSRAAHQWASHDFPPGLQVMGVVLVDDAPQVPHELERYVRYSARAWPATWRLRWVESIRLDPDPPGGVKGLPVWARALTKSLLKEATKATSGMKENQPKHDEGERA